MAEAAERNSVMIYTGVHGSDKPFRSSSIILSLSDDFSLIRTDKV